MYLGWARSFTDTGVALVLMLVRDGGAVDTNPGPLPVANPGPAIEHGEGVEAVPLFAHVLR